MARKPNPLDPGHIPGQHPATPERLPGHTADVPEAGHGGEAANEFELGGRPAFHFRCAGWDGITLDSSGANLPEVDATAHWTLQRYITLGVQDVGVGLNPEPVIQAIADHGFYIWRHTPE